MCYVHTSVRVSRLGPPHTLRLRPRHDAPRRVRSTPRLREPQLTASSHHASHYHTTPPPTRASTPYARRQIHARSPRALLGGGGLGGGEEQHGGRDALVGTAPRPSRPSRAFAVEVARRSACLARACDVTRRLWRCSLRLWRGVTTGCRHRPSFWAQKFRREFLNARTHGRYA